MRQLFLLGLYFLSMAAHAQPAQPLYKDGKAPIETRVQDLLGRMTVEEKVGQLSTVLGWEMYQKEGRQVGTSAAYRKAVDERHIGGLWATLRADPWTRKTLTTGLNPTQAAQAANALQKYAVEHTRLGIPMFLAEECPHGHMAIGTTVFPTAIGQGSTWNPALLGRMAAAIATEVRVQGGHIGYGPVLDLAREPRWSRVEETYGEDPVLTSQLGAAVVQGMQGSSLKSGRNVISTLKHFAAYGVPEGGHNGGSISTGVRELYQSFLPPVHAAVQAGVQSIMTSYNSIDGVPCSASEFLLTDVLRRQWGFQGFTVSDLGSISGIMTSHHVAATPAEAAALAINAGLDDDLSGYGYDKALLDALKQKLVSAETLDRAVGRVLRLKFEMGLFENPYVDVRQAARQVNSPAHVQLARQVAQESVVLLKNKQNLLPLAKSLQRIAVIGPNADNLYNQLGDYTAPQPASNIVTVLEGIRAKVSAATQVTYVKGCAIRDTSSADIAAAVAAARQAQVAVVVLGGSSARDFKTEYQSTGAATVATGPQALSDMESGEGYDRATLDLLGRQQELLEAVVATGTPVVVVLIKGRPLNLNWMAAHVPAMLDAWYPGQEGGNAVADVLFGDYNPAGRLPISVPRHVGQLPVYYNAPRPARQSYVELDSKPLYSFGYGLSYSQFAYSGLRVTSTESSGAVSVAVRFTVKNTSARAGDEVAQLYLRDDVSSVVTPDKQLRKFQRLYLKAGEQKEVQFDLTAEDLMLLNQRLEWAVEPGAFTVMIGAASDDIRLQGQFSVKQLITVSTTAL
ncbi:glycoside hydrolase family 3 N-terminal domain-containing protein [Hymenobacter endophyticus]|uniref:Glycoside hydrolase family 3 N-terminal domain-containing protein n=1 Tax=Hymenobacter endophyticus TaxID=3076335 RepID=A0ABU3TNA3_9BACT|nr:glycoside hydrolase family 3 N-terminal domain-containing protein [Hymenobacter endophyticus]MDU0372849.1 glycoside hydrolase family 3 N-terminal domain-containing protein [Hymenobacter endophyticus]